jgi:hypothetical integral membrane protein (TIGR02206 family)
MEKYFAINHDNNAFHLFSTEHLVTLLIIVLLGLGAFIFHKRLRGHSRFISYFLASLLLLSELSLHIWYTYYHAWSIRHALPLELSDITVLITIVMLFTKSAGLFRYLYFVGIASSIQAMLTPDIKYSFPHFRYIEFFVSHGGVFLACLFVAGVIRYKPTFRSLWVTVLIVDMYGACVYVFDRLIHANYLFLIKKPETTSLLNFLGPWPWYLLSVEGVMIITFLILYWPYWMIRKVKRG